MNEKHEPTTSSDLGGAPGGMGASTGADPRGPAAGMEHPQASEDRSFSPTQPGHTSDVGEGGGAMSGRGQERGPDINHQAQDAHEQAMRNRADEGVGGGGVAGAGTGGGGLGHDSELGAPSGGLGGDAGMGEGASGGRQVTGAMMSDQGEDAGLSATTGLQGGPGAGGGHGVRPVASGQAVTGDAADYGAPGAEPGPGVSGGGTDETSGTGENAVGGTGAAAGGDAHLGHDGTKLGDPMNAKRQVHSDDSRDIANGSGAD